MLSGCYVWCSSGAVPVYPHENPMDEVSLLVTDWKLFLPHCDVKTVNGKLIIITSQDVKFAVIH